MEAENYIQYDTYGINFPKLDFNILLLTNIHVNEVANSTHGNRSLFI